MEPYEGDPEDLAEQDQNALLNENPEAVEPPGAPNGTPAAAQGEVIGVSSKEAESKTPTGLSDTAIDALVALIDKYDEDEEEFRLPQLQEWKLLEKMWEGHMNNIWSEVARDWRDIEDYEGQDDLDLEGFEPRSVNTYRAHGESIIAALSAGVPGTKFFPDDADSQDDVSTAKVYSRAAQLIQRRNKAPLLLIKGLYILWNQGVIAAYNYSREDPRLGTIDKPLEGMVEELGQEHFCPSCAAPMVPGSEQCAACGYQGPHESATVVNQVPGIIDTLHIPRITEDVKFYSPLYFRVPHWIQEQKDTPYIGLDLEMSPGAVIGSFKEDIKDIREKVNPTKDNEKYDRWSRNLSDNETNLITLRQRWLRGWALEEIEDETAREELLAKYPNGCYVALVGDEFITARAESLDEHWTISVSPVSSHILARALGWSVKEISEMTNELLTMVLDNIEHGTPMTFIDTGLVNLQAYKKTASIPGSIYPVKVDPGQNIGNYIHETRPATLSEEVGHFGDKLEQMGQFASGAFPSIYGGNISGGSGTAREYVESRQQALQRLQITWRLISEFWTEVMEKSTTDYLNNLQYDERFVEPHGKDGFMNVWIKKSQATGKIGEVIAESSEKFPINWIQKQDMMMQMLQLKDPNILAAMFHPENSALVAETLGFDEFYIPGDDDRSKQLNEITELLTGQPMPMLGPMGLTLQSSVPIDKDIDDHEIHMQTIKAFLISDVGQQLKKDNIFGFENCLAHYREHQEVVAMQQMAQQAAMAQDPNSETPGHDKNPNVDAPQGV